MVNGKWCVPQGQHFINRRFQSTAKKDKFTATKGLSRLRENASGYGSDGPTIVLLFVSILIFLPISR